MKDGLGCDATHYTSAELRGQVVADEHVHELSRKYTGKDFHTPTDRVIVKIHPRRVFDYNSPAR